MQKPKITMFQNTNQFNISKVQDYIYKDSIDIVLVGSSLSNTMEKMFFKDKIYNLSFSGGSSLTGLEIIKKSGKIPKIILIESNIIFERDSDNKFIDIIYAPLLWQVKKFVPALQEKYQPLNIVISKVKGRMGKSHSQRMLDIRNDVIFKNQMKLKIKDIDNELYDFSEKLNILNNSIEYFEKLGTKIYFIEMPVEKEIQNSLKYRQTRDIINRKFDFLKINHDTQLYKTSDGIHLMYNSAYYVSQNLLKILERKE